MNPCFRPLISTLLLSASLTSGCGNYSLSLNDQLMYEPAQIFSDYRIDDPALRECVRQSLIDQSARDASELTDLNCSDAGIRVLAGLDVFSGLQRINLDNNRISDISTLFNLTELRLLRVRNNHLQSVSSQFCTTGLRELALAGNDALDCDRVEALAACNIRLLDRPMHCTEQTDQ